MADDKELTPAGLGCLVLVGIVVAVIYWVCTAGYTALDSNGWIPHNEETVITAQENWLVGENKQCWSTPLDARSVNKEYGYAFSKINCDEGSEHNIKITFYGREDQSEYRTIFWNCTRNDTSFSNNAFTCKETSAY